jgi:hypothetical protein
MGDASVVLLLTFARRGEEGAIAAAAEAVGRQVSRAQIVAIGTPVSAPILNGLGIDDVIIYGDGRTAWQAIREARGRSPGASAVVYGGPGVSGHLKLELLALVTGARTVYRCAPGKPPQAVKRVRLAASAAAKMLRAAASLAMAATICGVAFCYLRLAQMVAGGHDASRA